MPSRLRPTASFAADAILAGDPGRALLLAQELLEKPKMSNHARGLWGYTGTTPAGEELTIQSTGMGGPSAALVLADLVELGVRRAVRVGSCLGTRPGRPAGELVVVEQAIAGGGSAAAIDLQVGAVATPDAGLAAGLREALDGAAEPAAVASFDVAHPAPEGLGEEVVAVDMQTVAVLARAAALGVPAAAVLLVVETVDGARLAEEEQESLERRAGKAAAAVLSPST